MKASDYRSCPPVEEPAGLTAAAPGQGHLMPTPGDILGPFYSKGAPEHHHAVTIAARPTLTVTGSVLDQAGKPVPGAVIDWWQADEKGRYDNAGFHLRAKVRTHDGRSDGYEVGTYGVQTVMPGFYDISDPADPEPHEFRCAHVHVMITAPGFNRHAVKGAGIDGTIKVALLTQLYFAGGKFNDTDRWYDPRRCVKPVGDNPANVTFDFVLERE